MSIASERITQAARHFSLALSESEQTGLLVGIDRAALEIVISAAQTKHASPRQVILEEGGKAEYVYMLKSGLVRYYRSTEEGREILLGWLVSGDSFGLGTFLENPRPYIGTAEAIEDCELFVWNRAAIRRLAASYPRLAENAINILLRYLEHGVEKHVGVIARNAEGRLQSALFYLAQRTGIVNPGGIEVDVTTEELSSLAAVSSFTASRVLRKWQREGMISKERGNIVLHSPEKLIFH